MFTQLNVKTVHFKQFSLVFYCSEFSDCCLHLYCYIDNVLADISSSLLQVFVKLGSSTNTWTLRRYLFHVKPTIEFHMIKNCVYSIPCSCGKVYKCETCHPLKIRLEEHRKAVVWGEIKKSGMTDHIWKKKGNHLPLWGKVKIINREEHWRIRCLKESVYMFGYNDLLNRPNIEMNAIWEPIIKKVR